MTTTIQISQIINSQNASIHKYGLKVYEEIKKQLVNKVHVKLSFEGLNNVTSGFCNAAIGKIYVEFSDIADKFLECTHVTKDIWQEKIQSAINLVQNPEKLKIYDTAIEELFS
jgi:hypothetical protein